MAVSVVDTEVLSARKLRVTVEGETDEEAVGMRAKELASKTAREKGFGNFGGLDPTEIRPYPFVDKASGKRKYRCDFQINTL